MRRLYEVFIDSMLLIKGLPELNRRYVCFLLKQLIERLRMLKTKLVRYFSNSAVTGAEYFLCFFNELTVYMLLGALAGELPQHVT